MFYQKAIIYLFITCACLSFACSNLSRIDLTQPSDMEQVQHKLKKFITPDMQVNEITFMNDIHSLGNIMGSMEIVYTTATDTATRMSMLIRFPFWDVLKNEKDNSKRSYLHAGVSIKDFEFTVIPTLIVQATTHLNSCNLEYAGTRHFSIVFDEAANTVYEFYASGKSPAHECQVKAIGKRSFRRYCYCRELIFMVDANGTMRTHEHKPGNFEWIW